MSDLMKAMLYGTFSAGNIGMALIYTSKLVVALAVGTGTVIELYVAVIFWCCGGMIWFLNALKEMLK